MNFVPLHQKYVEIVRRVALEQHVIICDLARRFAQLPIAEVAERYFISDGMHLTAEGCLIVADSLLDLLERNGLLDSL